MGQPAGWYRDPSGVHAYRFWDGARWTSQVAGPTGNQYSDTSNPLPPQAPDPAPIPVQPPAQFAPPAVSDNRVRCPRCGSDQLSGQKSGYGAGKGCCGWIFAGPLGLLCGFCGANKTMVHCLSCGYRWAAGR